MRKARRRIQLFDQFKKLQSTRPWVHLYLNCLCICTVFFIMTFNRSAPDDYYLVRTLQVSGFPVLRSRPPQQIVFRVHLSQSFGTTAYVHDNQPLTLEEFVQQLAQTAAATQTWTPNVRVEVSYDGDVPYQAYINVISACHRHRILDCETVTLDAAEPLSN